VKNVPLDTYLNLRHYSLSFIRLGRLIAEENDKTFGHTFFDRLRPVKNVALDTYLKLRHYSLSFIRLGRLIAEENDGTKPGFIGFLSLPHR